MVNRLPGEDLKKSVFSNYPFMLIWTLKICNKDISKHVKYIYVGVSRFCLLIENDKKINWLSKNIFFNH